MSRIQKLYNEFGKTYYTLPLTITNVSGGVLILKKVYVQNNLENKDLHEKNIVFTIDDLHTDFSNSQQLNQVNYTVNHFGLNSNDIEKNDKVNFEYLINPNNTLNFITVFDPHASRNETVKGLFTAKIVINYVFNDTPQNEFYISLTGHVDEKNIVSMHGINYNNISTVVGVPLSNIIKLF